MELPTHRWKATAVGIYYRVVGRKNVVAYHGQPHYFDLLRYLRGPVVKASN